MSCIGISKSSGKVYIADIIERHLIIIPPKGSDARGIRYGSPWLMGVSGLIIITIPQPNRIPLDERNNRPFIADQFSNQIFIVDTAKEEVLPSIEVGSNPSALCIDPKTGYLYVADEDGIIRVVSP